MRKGAGREARFAYKDEQAIPLDTELTKAFTAEIARNREIASEPGVVAAAVGLDPESWKFTRILVSENEPGRGQPATAYEILYFAKPLLETLPLLSAA
jgi:hypothetical protein